MFGHAFGIAPSHRLLYLLSARRRITCTLRALHHAYMRVKFLLHVTKNSNNALTTAGFTPCLAHAIITFSGFVTTPVSPSLSMDIGTKRKGVWLMLWFSSTLKELFLCTFYGDDIMTYIWLQPPWHSQLYAHWRVPFHLPISIR